jgi:hypothetical protein
VQQKHKAAIITMVLFITAASSTIAGNFSNDPNIGRFKATEYRSGVYITGYLVHQACNGEQGGWWFGSPSTAYGTAINIEYGCGKSNEK